MTAYKPDRVIRPAIEFQEDSIFNIKTGDVVALERRPGLIYEFEFMLALEVPNEDQPRNRSWSLNNFDKDIKLWDFRTCSIIYMNFHSLILRAAHIFSKG